MTRDAFELLSAIIRNHPVIPKLGALGELLRNGYLRDQQGKMILTEDGRTAYHLMAQGDGKPGTGPKLSPK
jgi:hypothetical protein